MPATELANPNKNVLDGELLWKYLHLSKLDKGEIAKRIGTSVEQVKFLINPSLLNGLFRLLTLLTHFLNLFHAE